MIEPSDHLARTKGVTADKVFVSTTQPLRQVLMVNLTNRRTYLREVTVLGQMEVVDPAIVAVDEEGSTEPLGKNYGKNAAVLTVAGEKIIPILH